MYGKYKATMWETIRDTTRDTLRLLLIIGATGENKKGYNAGYDRGYYKGSCKTPQIEMFRV